MTIAEGSYAQCLATMAVANDNVELAKRLDAVLEPGEYASPALTWFGWSRPAGCFALVGTTRTTLTEAEVWRAPRRLP
jgi:hypothetical protein